ncbi:Psf2-domain-containing protein [Mycena leptocephala]|nr:Psf2-domain-containing protein [Mycena leptocephala]
MSLPPALRASLIACQQLVEIIPLISMERTAFIAGAYGPLRPPHRTRIPIWMALNLKQKKKCHIVAPEWLTVEYLQDKITQETTQAEFTKLPFRFAEISRVLLDGTRQLRTLLQDLREARQAKARAGLESLEHSTLGLSNLSAMEINEIRPFFIQAMAVLGQLRPGA